MKYLISLILILNIYPQMLKEGDSFDKIVAIVGKYKIMKSEIDGQLARYAQADTSIDFNDKKIRDGILDALIQEKLIVMKAIRDSVEATPDEMDQQWDMLVQQWKSQYGSINRVEKLFNKPINEIKYEYADQIEQRILAMKLQQMKFGIASISPNELEEFYQNYKDSLPVQDDKYEVAHIQLHVKADKDSKKTAYKKAMKIRDSLLLGVDFARLAEANSQDINTASDGGDLGWINKGRLFPEFEKAAFGLQTGETSLPIETPFGFHLIQTIEKQDEAIHTRHILIKVTEKEDKQQIVISKLLEIKEMITKADSSFEKMALKYSDDDNSKGFGGVIGKLSLAEMPLALRTVIEDLEEGAITDPIPYTDDETKPAHSIVKLVSFVPSHKVNLEKDKTLIENYAKNFKQQELMQEWIEKLKKEIYWEKL